MRPQAGYLPEVDGLRAIAVLMVITCHLHIRVWDWLSGQRGVTIFFVISGYLITSLALSEERNRGTLSLPGFYIRRSFRIFPLYYLVLAVYAILILGTHFGETKRTAFASEFPYLLFYFQEYPYFRGHNTALPFYQSWSLGIEEKFYLIWPALSFAMLRSRARARLLVSAALVGALPLFGQFTAPYASIMVGCLLALALTYRTAREWVCNNAGWGVWVGFTAAVTFHILAPTRPYHPWREVGYSIVIGWMLGTLLHSRSVWRRALGCRPLASVGRVSYGIYLVHILCLNAVERIVSHPILAYAATVAVSIAAAAVLYIALERPMIVIGRGLADRYIQRSRPARRVPERVNPDDQESSMAHHSHGRPSC